jgi:hypothetical protein
VFEVETEQNQTEVTNNIKKESARDQGALSGWGPIVESISLRQLFARALFELGFAFYFILAVAGVVLIASLVWAVYRRLNPDERVYKEPFVKIEGGRVTVGMAVAPSERYREEDDREALFPEGSEQHQSVDDRRALVQAREDEMAFDPLSRIGPTGNLRPGEVYHNTNGALPSLVAAPTAEAIFGNETTEDAAPLIGPAGSLKHRRGSVPKMKYYQQMQRDGHSRGPSQEDLGLDIPGEDKLKAVQRAGWKRSVERTLSRLQPSREVIDGDVAASYAMEGPKSQVAKVPGWV